MSKNRETVKKSENFSHKCLLSLSLPAFLPLLIILTLSVLQEAWKSPGTLWSDLIHSAPPNPVKVLCRRSNFRIIYIVILYYNYWCIVIMYITLMLQMVTMVLILTKLYAVLMIIYFQSNNHNLNYFMYCLRISQCWLIKFYDYTVFCIINKILNSNYIIINVKEEKYKICLYDVVKLSYEVTTTTSNVRTCNFK